MSRTYSVLLMHGLLFAADEGEVNYYRQAAGNETLVVKHVSVSADVGGVVAWELAVSGPAIAVGPYAADAPICQGYTDTAYMTSEWSGTHVIPPGYSLHFTVLAYPGADSTTGYLSISGYSLLDER